VLSSELHNYEKITTVEGGNVTIFVLDFPEKHIDIRDSSEGVAHVIKADIVASNGVVHLIDKVLIPGSSPAPGPGTSAPPRNNRRVAHVSMCNVVC